MLSYLFIHQCSKSQFWFKSLGTTAIINSEIILDLVLSDTHHIVIILYVIFSEIICYKKMLSFVKKYRLLETTDTSYKCISIVYLLKT